MKAGPATTFVLVDGGAGADVTPAFLVEAAAAIDHVLQHSFRAAWGCDMHCRAGDPALAANEVKVSLKATSDVPGAGGYHDDGSVNCFRDGLPSLSDGDFAFTVVISHEIFEAALDPGANRWASNGAGSMFAIEACDAVEGFSFKPIPAGQPGGDISISDFLLPSFFDVSGAAPFSRLNKPTAPFTTAPDNGADYQIVLAADDSGAQQVTAIGNIHPDRAAAKAHPGSRSSRRGLPSPLAQAPTDPAPATGP